MSAFRAMEFVFALHLEHGHKPTETFADIVSKLVVWKLILFQILFLFLSSEIVPITLLIVRCPVLRIVNTVRLSVLYGEFLVSLFSSQHVFASEIFAVIGGSIA